jgi:DNA-binding MarR family transcriptional regulator
MDEMVCYGIALHAVDSFIDRQMRPAMEKYGIRRTYGPVLLAVRTNPGCSLKEVADLMRADKALITRVSSSLISEGFLVNSSGKPRAYSLNLTPKGRKALDIIDDELRKAWGSLTQELTAEEREALGAAISKMVAAAESTDGGRRE